MLFALAGCGGVEWSKQGVTQEQAARDYAECRHAAETAQRRDIDIDTDIAATRSHDWQRTGILTMKRNNYADANEARSGDFVERCMVGKGYSNG